MADGDDRQATFGSDGSLETDTTPDATGDNDFGEAKEPNETDGGYSRYVVSSLLQKAVRRSDEEIAAWAAWELARSGYAWNLWDRLNLYVVEPPGWQRRGPHDRALRGAGHRALGARRVEGSTLCDPRRAGGRPRALDPRGLERRRVLLRRRRGARRGARARRGACSRLPRRRPRTGRTVRRHLRRPHR